MLAEALGDMKVLHGLESDQVASCEFELLEAMIADGAVQAARERVSQLESIMLARSEVDDQRLTNLFATHLSVLEPEYEQAAALFQILLDRCAGDDACTARSIQIFLENAPPDIMSLLHIELRARLEESIESQGGSDPDMVRVAMEMMLFETELESRADALDATILGEQLGMRAIRMLARLDGASNSELQSTIERVEARLSSLLGDEHDLTLATRAEALVGTPDEVEAIRALQRAAIVSPIEERRRILGLDAKAPHAGVDHDVHGEALFGLRRGAAQRVGHFGGAQDRLEPVGDDLLGMLGQRRRQDHECRVNPGLGQSGGLGGMGDAERVVAESGQMAGDDLRSVAVGIGFDRRP